MATSSLAGKYLYYLTFFQLFDNVNLFDTLLGQKRLAFDLISQDELLGIWVVTIHEFVFKYFHEDKQGIDTKCDNFVKTGCVMQIHWHSSFLIFSWCWLRCWLQIICASSTGPYNPWPQSHNQTSFGKGFHCQPLSARPIDLIRAVDIRHGLLSF